MSSNRPIQEHKRTKILATIGPATDSKDQIQKLVLAGVNGLRLNFSHGDYEERRQQITWIRELEEELERPLAVVQDLQGPKIRLGDLEQPVEVEEGQIIKLALDPKGRDGVLPVQYDLSTKVKPGERILIFDGKIHTEVTAVEDDVISLRIGNNGWLMKRKGINLPDTDLGGDVLTDKDLEDMSFGVEQGVDYVAISFVQTAHDVEQARQALKQRNSTARLITKIETNAAAEHVEEIVQASDGVMVARGDLAYETTPERVPIVQRKIVGLAQKYGKVSIIATQMLASMVEEPSPTRAEVSDVATAVILVTDAVMLSEETAAGDFPIETVQFMRRIIRYTEENAPVKPLFLHDEDHTMQSSISSAVMTLAHQVKAAAIVAETASGSTARSIAAHRPNMPIVMVTHNVAVARQLAMVYGGEAYVRESGERSAEKMTEWLQTQNILTAGDVVVITSGKYPGQVGGTDTIKVRKLE